MRWYHGIDAQRYADSTRRTWPPSLSGFTRGIDERDSVHPGGGKPSTQEVVRCVQEKVSLRC